MVRDIKKLLEFTSREEWVEYAMSNMRKIEAQRREESGVEILLVAKRGTIGKWNDESGYGYIEEYRDNSRLADEHKEEDSD
ncbi:MAG: hypothetical protein GY808_09125 [Gammaproteobacteria bacterium]|nr:hypothetical protein [Gammaproteobacteria bacterium]